MKIAAIISEYNPFHNGHKYQIDMVKKEYDAVIAVMSGNFVQRGGLALCDKWTRAKTALLNGVDLVVELPVIYALNTAEKFASGGVKIIDRMGVVDGIFFGSENGDITDFYRVAQILLNEPEAVSEKIARLMREGYNFPTARELAYDGMIDKSFFSKPNNILGVEYIKALLTEKSDIEGKTIKRIGAGYNDIRVNGGFASATAIRELIKNGEDYREHMPESAWEIIKNAPKFSSDMLLNILKYSVISGGREYIAGINDVSEGLHNKIYDAVREGQSLDEIAGLIKSKRYTMSRIRRILYSVILRIGKENPEPQYIRVLGMNGTGKKILKMMKDSSKLPIVIKTADFSSPMLEKDIFATDVAFMTLEKESKMGMDYKVSPVII